VTANGWAPPPGRGPRWDPPLPPPPSGPVGRTAERPAAQVFEAPAGLAADHSSTAAEPRWQPPDAGRRRTATSSSTLAHPRPAPAETASRGRASAPAAAARGGDRRRTAPRAIGFAVASALMPGLGQALQRRWRAALLFGVPTLALLAIAAWAIGHDEATLVDWTVDSTVLRGLGVAGLVWAVLCYTSAAEAAVAAWPASFAHRSTRRIGLVLVLAVTLAALLPGAAGAWVATRQNSFLNTVFSSSEDVQVAQPSPLEDLGITTPTSPSSTSSSTSTAAAVIAPASASTTIAPTSVPATATSAAPARAVPARPVPTTTPPAGRWNIVLLGGDAGPHRWGLRTDTMIVVSIDRRTGDLASISVPRNLQHLPMPRGVLRRRFPAGFNDLANALYPYVATHPDLHLDAAESVKGALAELLGIHIDNYVLVDLEGFIKIIDSLGGVTVILSNRVPLVPNIDGKTKEAPYVGPGAVMMNGTMALSFVRTRDADSDYQRMKRQRCLLAAVAHKTSPVQLARSYPSLVSAVEGAFRSDIPRSRLGDLVRLFAKVHVDDARTLVLVPPVITPAHPDIARIRTLVTETLAASPAAGAAVTRPTC